MILTGDNRSDPTETCPSATSSTTNYYKDRAWIEPGSPRLEAGDKPPEPSFHGLVKQQEKQRNYNLTSKRFRPIILAMERQ
jgi:hypothetical protein